MTDGNGNGSTKEDTTKGESRVASLLHEHRRKWDIIATTTVDYGVSREEATQGNYICRIAALLDTDKRGKCSVCPASECVKNMINDFLKLIDEYEKEGGYVDRPILYKTTFSCLARQIRDVQVSVSNAVDT